MRTARFARALRATACALAAAAAGHAIAAETVKIAFIEVLSGPFAFAGEGSLRQLREVVARVNASARPDDPQFEIVPFDGKGTPQESTTVLRAAFDQNIRYVTQGGGSGVAAAIIDAVNKTAERDPANAMVYMNYNAMDPTLTNEKCSFWHFRFYPSSNMKMEALTSYLQKKPEVKKVFLFNQNYALGQQVAKAVKEYLPKKRPDIEIVGEDYVPIATVRDFAPYVAKIAASGADTVITSNWGSDLTLFFKAAKDYGLGATLYTLNANNPGGPIQLGPWGTEKVAVIWNWSSNADTPDLAEIAETYKKKGAKDDFIYVAHWYSVNMLRDAIRQARSTDPRKVAAALEGLKMKASTGTLEMRAADHQLQAPLYLGVWAKQGSPGVRFDAENTGYGFRTEAVWDAQMSSQPTTCQMKRPG